MNNRIAFQFTIFFGSLTLAVEKCLNSFRAINEASFFCAIGIWYLGIVFWDSILLIKSHFSRLQKKSDTKEAIESNETINKTLEILLQWNILAEVVRANKPAWNYQTTFNDKKTNFVQLSAKNSLSFVPTMILSHDYYAAAFLLLLPKTFLSISIREIKSFFTSWSHKFQIFLVPTSNENP